MQAIAAFHSNNEATNDIDLNSQQYKDADKQISQVIQYANKIINNPRYIIDIFIKLWANLCNINLTDNQIINLIATLTSNGDIYANIDTWYNTTHSSIKHGNKYIKLFHVQLKNYIVDAVIKQALQNYNEPLHTPISPLTHSVVDYSAPLDSYQYDLQYKKLIQTIESYFKEINSMDANYYHEVSLKLILKQAEKIDVIKKDPNVSFIIELINALNNINKIDNHNLTLKDKKELEGHNIPVLQALNNTFEKILSHKPIQAQITRSHSYYNVIYVTHENQMKCFLNRYFKFDDTTKWITENIDKKIKIKKKKGDQCESICNKLQRKNNFKFNNGAIFLLKISDNIVTISMIFEGNIAKDNYFTKTEGEGSEHVFSNHEKKITLNFLSRNCELSHIYKSTIQKIINIYIIINCKEKQEDEQEKTAQFIIEHLLNQSINYLFTSQPKDTIVSKDIDSIVTLDTIVNSKNKLGVERLSKLDVSSANNEVIILPCSQDTHKPDCFDKIPDRIVPGEIPIKLSEWQTTCHHKKQKSKDYHQHNPQQSLQIWDTGDNCDYLKSSHLKISWKAYDKFFENYDNHLNNCKNLNFVDSILKTIAYSTVPVQNAAQPQKKPNSGGYYNKYLKYKYKYLEMKSKLNSN